jgi:hypothetical protein
MGFESTQLALLVPETNALTTRPHAHFETATKLYLVAMKSRLSGLLDVVTLEEGLQVEDGQHISLRQGQELAQRSVGLDGLLVHQVVGLGVGQHTLGHVRAGHGGALGLAQEGAQLIGDLGGLVEHAGSSHTTLGLGAALAAAVGLLDHTGSLLLDTLQGSRSVRGGGLQAGQLLVELGDGLLELGTQVLLGHLRHRGDGGHHLSHGRSHRGGSLRGLDRLDRHRGGYRGGSHRGRGSGSGSGRLLGRLGGAHLDARVGGVIGRHLTRYAIRVVVPQTRQVWPPHPPKLPPLLRPSADFSY